MILQFHQTTPNMPLYYFLFVIFLHFIVRFILGTLHELRVIIGVFLLFTYCCFLTPLLAYSDVFCT